MYIYIYTNISAWTDLRRDDLESKCGCMKQHMPCPRCAPLSAEQWQEWSGRVMTESWLTIFLFGHREYQAMKEAKLWTEEALGHEIASACRLSPLDSRAMAEDVFSNDF